jgi:D-alanyl-D-alanine carboxypeptidase
MRQSSWVNPNGLPADDQITSARDMAVLARAILLEFPDYDGYWNIQAIRLGKRVMRNTNSLIFRYPEADGMKTGFICASGFNVVATARRGNRRLIAVVLGAPSSAVRAAKAAHMFESAFNTNGLTWLMPSFGTVDQLPPIAAAPPNLREAMCGKHRRRPAAETADDEDEGVAAGAGEPGGVVSLASGPKPSSLVNTATINGPPVEVYIGPARRPRDPAVAAARPVGAGAGDPPTVAPRGKPGGAAVGLLALPERSAPANFVPVPRPRPGAGKPPRAAANAGLAKRARRPPSAVAPGRATSAFTRESTPVIMKPMPR